MDDILVFLQFPQANVALIIGKLKQLGASKQDEIARNDPTGGSNMMSYDSFRQFLQSLAGSALTEHEIISVARFYQDRKDERLDLGTLLAIAQDQLRKVNYENFQQVLEQCIHYDSERWDFTQYYEK